MTKEAFLGELRTRLYGLRQDDMEDRLSYYNELIEERMAYGMSEEEALANIGTMDAIVDQIMSEIPLSMLVKDKVKPRRKISAGLIALLVLGFPIWFPLLVAIVAILFSLYVVLWALVICLYAVSMVPIGAMLGVFVCALTFLKNGSLGGALMFFGGGCICAALTIVWFFGCTCMARAVLTLAEKFFLGIKTSFVGKEVA